MVVTWEPMLPTTKVAVKVGQVAIWMVTPIWLTREPKCSLAPSLACLLVALGGRLCPKPPHTQRMIS